MEFTSMAALFGAMVVLAVIPGPGVFAVVARSMASGLSHGLFTIVGIVTGDFVFIILAIYGLSAMAEIMGNLFAVVKYLGGAYFIWLGITLLRSKPETVELDGVRETSWRRNFFSGLFITLGNPKAMLFYIGFFPAFMDLKNVSVTDTATIMMIATLAIGGVMLGYAYMASKARTLFKSTKAKQRMNYTAGSVMLGTGTVLLTRG